MAYTNDALEKLDAHVGRMLRKRRQNLNLTLVEVGEKLGISHQQIQKYEKAQTRISGAALYILSKLYGVQPEFFFEGFLLPGDPHNLDNNTQDTHEDLFILLVENDPVDEFIIRQAIKELKSNIDVFTVHDGMQALDLLRQKISCSEFRRPDIILANMDISKKDGLSLLRDIKRDREISDIPFIMLVNTVIPDALKNTYTAQCAGYINKAQCKEALKQKIQNFVSYWADTVILPYHRLDCIEQKPAA
jgi:CheY-like chemotaxis protein